MSVFLNYFKLRWTQWVFFKCNLTTNQIQIQYKLDVNPMKSQCEFNANSI